MEDTGFPLSRYTYYCWYKVAKLSLLYKAAKVFTCSAVNIFTRDILKIKLQPSCELISEADSTEINLNTWSTFSYMRKCAQDKAYSRFPRPIFPWILYLFYPLLKGSARIPSSQCHCCSYIPNNGFMAIIGDKSKLMITPILYYSTGRRKMTYRINFTTFFVL
jgi:hypothetical protein